MLDKDDTFDPFKWFFGMFASFGCGFVVVWVVSALASLALIAALIYLIVKFAGTL